MSAFADFQVTFGADASLPSIARRPTSTWRPAGTLPGVWSASLAADGASTLVQTRIVAPWSVWSLGEISRYDSLSAPADPLGAFVLDLRAGKAKPASLDGHFVLFAWNSETRQWHCWTNRFATFHAYLALGARCAALGTFHPAVCRSAGAAHLDWEGLAGFFAMGFFPEDRTHFEEARILRPASHYVLSDAGSVVREERYWEWEHRPERAPAFATALEMFGDTLGSVMREATARGRVAVPVSGGLDSRTTVALLPKETDRLWCYTYGYGQDSIETRIAQRVAHARGLECDAFEIPEYLFDRMEDVLAATEGFNDVTQTRQVRMSAQLSERADTVIAAHMGDLWLDHAGSATGDDAAFRKVRKPGGGWLLEHLCAPRVRGNPERAVRGAVSRELARVSHIADPDFRMKAFKTDGWVFRWTATGLRAYQLGVFPKLPFYDSRIADLFCTMPTDYVRGRRLQVEWIKRYAADLARVTWQAHGANLYMYPFARWLYLPERAVKRGWRRLVGQSVIERNWEVQFLSPHGRERLRQALEGPSRRLHEFVDPAAVRTLLDRFFANPFEDKRGYTVSMLLTFSEWLERYA